MITGLWLRLAAVGVLLAGLAGAAVYVRHKGFEAGAASVQVRFDVYKAGVDSAAAKAIADAQSKEHAAQDNNRRIEDDYSRILSAAAADRDTYFGLLQQARNKVRGCAASQATDTLVAATAGEANIGQRIDRAVADTISEHLSNSAQLDALIAALKPQLSQAPPQ